MCTNNKSANSSLSFRENLFLSPSNINKMKNIDPFTENSNSFLHKFVSLKVIDDENLSNEKKRKCTVFYAVSPKKTENLLQKKIRMPSMEVFSLQKDENSLFFFKNSENLKKNMQLKYLNFKTPKNEPQNNEDLNIKLCTLEDNLTLRKYLKNNVKKWKNEHQIHILQGLLDKKNNIPNIFRDRSVKKPLLLKKIDISKNSEIHDKKNLKFGENREKKENLRRVIKKQGKLLDQTPSFNFNGEYIPLNLNLNLTNDPKKEPFASVFRQRNLKIKKIKTKIHGINEKSQKESPLNGLLIIK